tara:strand:+ start:167 stop:415 length:249 start_codon:yes stop_codon:yes gene_type:complete
MSKQLELFERDSYKKTNGRQSEVNVMSGEIQHYTVAPPIWQNLINAMMHSAKFMTAEEWIDSPESEVMAEAKKGLEYEKQNS